MPQMKTLLQLRNERKIKQKVILDLMNINRRTLYRWEHCITSPDHWQLLELCKFYAVKRDSVIVSTNRPDPLAWLGDKPKEEWDREKAEFIKKTQAWWDENIGKPGRENFNANSPWDCWGKNN